MSFLDNLVFDKPWLLALLPLPLILRYILPPFRDSRKAVRVPHFDVLVKSVDAKPSKGAVVRTRSFWQAVIYLVCWISLVVALARPQQLQPPISREIPSRDLLLAIDLSGSMETEDFVNAEGKKVDRLTAVKEVLDDFLTQRKGDRVAMVVFGTGAFVQIPFTQDLEVCRELLDQTAVRMAGPKTSFGDAIGLGITLFQRSELDDKVMIALTDGNDTGSKVPPEKASKIAADNGIVIHTIGVGDPRSAGEEMLDEDSLKEVAANTGGQYFFAADRKQLAGIYDELDKISQREVESLSYQPKIDLFHFPLALMLVSTWIFFTLQWVTTKTDRRLTVDTVSEDKERVAA